ncbi:hypothetical protein [Aliidiomarina celeris]|uniref:hypothetical protein n=1 Tax=Aliidiomarina celeris TaxID=2249428 RepID=UPI000DEBC8BC|nr:hypothetical protein [Aliidiomarina celeris]
MTTIQELKILRVGVFASLALSAGLIAQQFLFSAPTHFETLSVERLNIVERDGTVKLLITNTERFPVTEQVNGRVLNEDRKKRSGMLFFNEDGIEAGGFIYDGSKTADGHSSGLSLTFDQYDGDQVMQLLTTDMQRGEQRRVSSALAFNDRPVHETQQGVRAIMNELNAIEDREARRAKYLEYEAQGLVGGATRVLVGKTGAQNNGLFLFASDGSPRAMFYVDQNDQVQLQFMNAEGEVTHQWTNE